jgi:hypothetical protein
MSKKLIFSLVCLALFVGWGACLFNAHEEIMRNCLLAAGIWYAMRFFFRGKREQGFGKWWEISISLLEVTGIGFILGVLNMVAVNIQAAVSSIGNLFGGNATTYSGLYRIYLVVIELVAPALIGLIYGLAYRKTKKK